jgi:hypothetical protein
MSQYSDIAGRLKTIIETEFAAEGYTVVLDNLHGSLGRYRVDIGIAPERESEMVNDALVLDMQLRVKFYHLWTDEIDPDTRVNPTQITDFAERFRRAVRAANSQQWGSGSVWYFNIREIVYPDDPTGNKSRFEAVIVAKGNNSGIVETTA